MLKLDESRWRRRMGWMAPVVGVLLTGCELGTEPSTPELSMDGALEIAAFLADVEALASVGVTLESRTGSHSFSRSAPCPAGGEVSVSGSGESVLNGATRVRTNSWSVTQTHAACAIFRERNDTVRVAVINGSVIASGTASYQLPEAPGGARTLLSYSATRSGSTTTSLEGRERVCAVDITETFDPATRSFAISGTICGRQVDLTRPEGAKRSG